MAHKSPGKSHREGITLAQLFRLFPDDDAAKKWFVDVRWPNGVTCPRCQSDNIQSNVKHKTQDYRCRSCRKWFSARTGTVMESSKLGLQTWMVAVYLLSTSLKGQSSMKLHRDLGITQKSAWHLAMRIRETWDKDGGLFAGPVEIDETYMGGRRKNMSDAKRKTLTGRGPVGKTAVIGAKDRDSNKVVAVPVPDTTKPVLQGFVRRNVEQGATVYTDENPSYEGMTDFDHESVKHSVAEYVRDMTHTNGIESFWSMLKRGHKGVYHKMSEKHLARYVTEFSGRHNIRNQDTIYQMIAVARGIVGKPLRYADLTG